MRHILLLLVWIDFSKTLASFVGAWQSVRSCLHGLWWGKNHLYLVIEITWWDWIKASSFLSCNGLMFCRVIYFYHTWKKCFSFVLFNLENRIHNQNLLKPGYYANSICLFLLMTSRFSSLCFNMKSKRKCKENK